MRTRIIVALTAASLLAGCATAPTGASYVPLVDVRAEQKEAYEKDLKECQWYATQRGDAVEGAVAGAVAGALFGALLGAVVGVSRNQMAGVGALVAGAEGATRNEGTQRDIIRRCMTGRGYTVLD